MYVAEEEQHLCEIEALALQHKATVQPDGTLRFRSGVFNSPSLAASAVTHCPMNGWDCWRYEAAPGRWEKLYELRRD